MKSSRIGNTGNTFDEICTNPGTPRTRSSKAMMYLGGDTSGEAIDGRSHKRSRLESDPDVPPWAGLLPDVLGIVLRFLSCLIDRATMRSVCRHWRAVARSHVLPPPLPLLVRPTFRLSSLSAEGALRLLRRVPVPEEVGADPVRSVGSSDGWLVGVTPSKDHSEHYRDADEECFLLNIFSHAVVHLPRLRSLQNSYSGYSYSSVPVINFSHELYFDINGLFAMSLRQVVLSASPGSGSKYIVAASSYRAAEQKIALWQPGMTFWHVCVSSDIAGPVDLAFFMGKLYVLRRPSGRLYAFDLEEDDRGVIVSRVERGVTEQLQLQHNRSCNMVVWRGNLVLIIRYYDGYTTRTVVKVEVFAVDFSTNPIGLIKIHNFDGDCIFVDSGGCKSFPANLHDGVQGDHIYFLPDHFSHYDSFVYNMRDGGMRPFAGKLLVQNFEEDNFDFPVWLFPSDGPKQI